MSNKKFSGIEMSNSPTLGRTPTPIIDMHNKPSQSINAEDQNANDKPNTSETEPAPFHLTKLQFFYIGCFIMTGYVAFISNVTIVSQYIYFRYAKERGVYDGGLSSNSSVDKCQINSSDPTQIKKALAEKDASTLNMQSSFVSGIAGSILVVIYGAYSDRMGRKLTIMWAWGGYFLQTALLVAMVLLNLPSWTYIIASLLGALGGSFGSMLAGIFSLLADATTKKQRSVAIGIYETVLGLSVVVSQMVIGVLIQSFGFEVTAVGFGILFALSGFFMLAVPETLRLTPQPSEVDVEPLHDGETEDGIPVKAIAPRFENPLVMGKAVLKIFTVDPQRGYVLGFLMAGIFLVFSAMMSLMSVDTLYLFNAPFCFTPEYLGYYRGVKMGLSLGMAMIVIVAFRRCLPLNLLIIVGLISGMVSNTACGMAYFFVKKIALYILITNLVVTSLSSLSFPLLRSKISQIVTPREQGVAFACIACLEMFANMVSSVTMNGIYAATIHIMPNLVYFITTGIGGVGIICVTTSIWLHRKSTSEDKQGLLKTM